MKPTRLIAWKELLIIAWPLIISNSFWNLQLTIDRIFLGIYSTESLGAAMAVMGVFWVPMALLQQTASYITAFVAQYYGAKDYEKIGSAFWQSIYVSIFGGILFIGLIFLSSPFFKFIGHSPGITLLEIDYFDSLTYSALPAAITAAVSGYFTGLGNTRIVIGINFIGLISNAILDYIMIFGKFGCPTFGVAGAGYATSIANYLAAFYGIYLILQSTDSLKFKILQSWKLDLKTMIQFLKYGIPNGFQWALEGLAFTVFLMMMGHMSLGDAALSSSSIAVTVMMLSVLPSMGIAQAVMTLVGQNLGAKNAARAEQITWTGVEISAIYITIVAASFFFIPEFYLSWFKNDQNPELWSQVLELAPQMLKLVALFTLFDSIYLNLSFALKGAGDTRYVSLLALIIPWPFFVIPTYFSRHLENAAIIGWRWVALYVVILCFLIYLRFRGGKWKKMSITEF